VGIVGGVPSSISVFMSTSETSPSQNIFVGTRSGEPSGHSRTPKGKIEQTKISQASTYVDPQGP
jgi:hypothetical protein